MKRPILDSRRAVLAVVAAFPGGRECAATCLGLDLKQFDNKLYENPSHRPLTDEQVLQLEKVAGTSYLPDYAPNGVNASAQLATVACNNRTRASRRSVSYTHLDVYKRQGAHTARRW